MRTAPTPELPAVSVFLRISPVSATCVKVTSESAPKLRTTPSLLNVISSPKVPPSVSNPVARLNAS